MNFDQKILIVRFSSLGDIVQSTSPLKTIRKVFTNSQITFLTLKEYVPLLEQHPDIDLLISIKRKHKFKRLIEIRNYLKSKKFSIIFDLHNSIRSNIVTYQISEKIYRIKKPRLLRFLLFFFHLNKFNPNFSILRLYHYNIGPFWDMSHKIPPTLIKLSRFEKEKAKEILNAKGIKNDFLAIIPGAAWGQKQWSSKKYIRVLEKINLPAVLIGSKKDIICNKIALGFKKAVNLAGKTDLRLAVSIISNATKVIGSDTGLVHAAEALGKKVIMIMGPTSKQTGGGTIKNKSVIIEKDIFCRPCSQNGKFPCFRANQECMDLIVPNDVVAAFYKEDQV